MDSIRGDISRPAAVGDDTVVVNDLVQRRPQRLPALPFRSDVITRRRIRRRKPQSARHREDQEQELRLEFE